MENYTSDVLMTVLPKVVEREALMRNVPAAIRKALRDVLRTNDQYVLSVDSKHPARYGVLYGWNTAVLRDTR